MIAEIMALLFVIGIPALIIYCIRADYKEWTARDKYNAEMKVKLTEEAAKMPKSRVAFMAGVPGCCNLTYGQDVSADVYWSRDGYAISPSLQEAEKLMRNSYDRGYFRGKNNKTYPTCNIVEAWTEVIK